MKKYSEIKHDCTIPESEAYELGKDAQHQQDLRDFIDYIKREGTTAYICDGQYTYETKFDNVVILDLGDLESLKQLVK